MSAETIQSIINAASSLKVGDANEAMTRLKLIDTILFEFLQWSIEDVTVEDRVAEDGTTQFSDYTVSTGRQSILVEAKKIGVNFDGIPRSRKAVCKRLFGKSAGGVAQLACG